MTQETLYDHPLYYDILFGFDRSPEANFYASVFQCHGIAPTERVLEVACGTARVARLLSARGWTMVGVDNRDAMAAFVRKQSAADGCPVDARLGEMASFRSERPLGAAFNPMSSYRLLHDPADADTHLAVMADNIRPGGIYVLDLEFADRDAPNTTTDEEWTMSRGDVEVRATDDAVHVTDAGVSLSLAWGEQTHLRNLPREEFDRSVERSGQFRIESLHPESGRSTDGVSLWDVGHREDALQTGRALVVLQRL
jgi:SAM-dependent methyltransferase